MRKNIPPPHDIEAEQSIIASCLLKPQAVVNSVVKITSDDFYSNNHKEIFKSIEDLFNSGKSVDIVTVMNDLKSRGKLESIGVTFLTGLSSYPAFASRVNDYCDIVIDKSRARKLIPICQEAINDCGDGQPFNTISDSLGKKFFDIVQSNEKQCASVGDVIGSVADGIEERFKQKRSIIGIPTGFCDIDYRLLGLCSPDLIVIAGRPSMGKTSLVLNMAENSAMNGYKWGIFSLEMDKEQLVLKMVSKFAEVDFTDLRRGKILDSEWPRIHQARKVISDLPIYIDDTAAVTPTQLRAKAMMMKVKYGIDALAVDYIQLMRVPGLEGNKTAEVTEISRSLKQIAKELKIPVVALSQLNRGVDGRTDKRPGMSDLRDSGAIEQDADVIGFIYRDEVYNRDDDNPAKGIAEVNFPKIRLGEPGMSKLLFQGKYSRFLNYDN